MKKTVFLKQNNHGLNVLFPNALLIYFKQLSRIAQKTTLRVVYGVRYNLTTLLYHIAY